MSEYHTAACHGKPGCKCLSDHREWEAECETLSTFEVFAFWICVAFAYLGTFALACGFAGYVWVRWGDAIAKFFN